MDFERVDSFPEYNLFFSPNWYSHQIADISPSGLCALGCNDEVQLIDLSARRPITSLYIKTPQNDKVINDINERKVTAVLVTDYFIVFSTVSGYLTIFEISNNNIICKFCDQVLANVQISCIKELRPEDCELELLLTDSKNKIIFAKYKDGMVDQLNLERQGNNHATKALEILDYKDEQFYTKVMDNGTFNIWTSYFEEAVYNVDIGHIINTASFGIFDGLMIISLISRKNRILVCQVALEKVLDDFLLERKFVHTNGANFRLLVNLELQVETPFLPASSLNKIKLRFHNRIINMNDQRIVITSKDGNMYLTDVESLMKIKEDQIIMKPAAYEDNENPFYEMLDENPHFKNIYFAKLLGETLVVIGMDRLISFWKVNKYRVQYDFNIKCLGSKATTVAISPLEPQSFLLCCNDNTMRLWNTGKKVNRFITTILWKGLDKKRIKRVEFHPTEESIIAFTSDKELSLMDIHAHTVISEFKIGELYDGETVYAQWLHREVVEKLVDSKFENQIKGLAKTNKNYKSFMKTMKNNTKLTSKYQVLNNKYQKDVDPQFLYVTFVQNKGFIIADFKLGTVFCVNYLLEKFVSSVEIVDCRLESKSIFFLLGDKKGNLIIIRFQEGNFSSYFLEELHTALISEIKANPNYQYEKGLVVATGSYDRNIKVIRIGHCKENLAQKNVEILHTFRHKFRISHIDWDPFNPHRFLNACQKHVTIQVWSLDPEKDQQDAEIEGKKYEMLEGEEKHYVANIRGHKGFITAATWSKYDKDCILTSSDDQSVKIWNLVNIKYRKPPGKKKSQSKMGEVIMEEDDDSAYEDDEQEFAQGKIQNDRYEKFTSTNKKPQRKEYQTPRNDLKESNQEKIENIENPDKEQEDKDQPQQKQFKTMNISSQAYVQQSVPQMTEKQYIQNGMTMCLMNLMKDPSVKKFYQNQVLDLKFKKLEKYSDMSKIKVMFDSAQTVNDPNFNIDQYHDAVFYILRSTCDDDIHKSIKYGLWTSTHRNNQMLNDVYRKCQKNKVPLFLFFTVVKSGQFVGVAQMVSEVRFNYIFNYWWEELKWSGVFSVKWIYIKDVHHEDVQHIIQKDIPITKMRDGSMVDYENGKELMEIFRNYGYVSDIFEEFSFMDGREEKLRMKRDSFYNYILQLRQKGFLVDDKFRNKSGSQSSSGQYRKKKNYQDHKQSKKYQEPKIEYVKKE